MSHRNRLLLSSLFLVASAHGQAPIERRPPPTLYDAHPWPSSAIIKPGQRLLLHLRDDGEPVSCRFAAIDNHGISCARDHSLQTFSRADISIVERVPHAHIAALFFKAGLASLGVSLLCGVDGGPVCITPAVLGLSLIAASIAMLVIQLHENAQNTLIYSAPMPDVPRRP